MKDLMISGLKDLYGSLLTEKQNDVITQYYDFDYSLKEIAENMSITRQAVHAALRQGERALHGYEKNLKFFAKTRKINELLIKCQETENLEEQYKMIEKVLEITRG